MSAQQIISLIEALRVKIEAEAAAPSSATSKSPALRRLVNTGCLTASGAGEKEKFKLSATGNKVHAAVTER